MSPGRVVVQLHDAARLHDDARLQVGDTLRSWAVPRGPSLDPAQRRLAVQVDDHALAAGEFEGVHRGQARGSGAVTIWDEGTVVFERADRDHLSFVLAGHKLNRRFGLRRTGGRQWVLVKADDDQARRGSDVVADAAGQRALRADMAATGRRRRGQRAARDGRTTTRRRRRPTRHRRQLNSCRESSVESALRCRLDGRQ